MVWAVYGRPREAMNFSSKKKIWDWMVETLCSVFTQSVTVMGWG